MMRALFPLVLVTCVMFGLGVLSGGCVLGEDIPSADKVRKSIEADIKPGATLAEIQAYLDAEHIDHGPGVDKASDWSELEEYNLPPDALVYAAIVRGSRLSSVSIIFVLDRDLRFQRLILIERPPM